jgi:hypothetical protein
MTLRTISRKRILLVTMLLALLIGLFAAPGKQLASGMTERLANGNFESGFHPTPAGHVGNGWNWFNNGGAATYGYYDDTWAPVVYDGQHSQLIEINTYGRHASDPDRYSGIFQKVAVVPGESYDLTIRGMLRALEDDPDRNNGSYSYRVEYGIDYSGGTDWRTVDNWVELPWDEVHPRLTPGSMESYSTNVVATSKRLTLYLRVWKKWGTAVRELDVNLDAISLKGAMPGAAGRNGVQVANATKLAVSFEAPAFPVVGWNYTISVQSSNEVGVTQLALYDNGTLLGSVSHDVGPLSLSHDFAWTPTTTGKHTLKAVAHDAAGAKRVYKVRVRVGKEKQFLFNGGFERGFGWTPAGMVGSGWGSFHSSGSASYGFYDDTWAPVVYGGTHSQLIEINTKGRHASEPDRYAGIYQTVRGLAPGATYKIKLHGMLRVMANDPDREGYNYRVQLGIAPYGGTDWTAVDNWVELPWDTVYTRLEPGTMSETVAVFEAPSKRVTVFVRAWKKWGTGERELDVNLDAITLKGYK